jgi:hypothetical protein
MKKMNCWDFKSCGRQASGFMPGESGVCPAFSSKQLHGVHGGINGGRACWTVTGTMCGNRIQGSYRYKIKNCLACDFFNLVKGEEGKKFINPDSIIELHQISA